jgi:predicted nucleic acid-binding protein
LISLLDNTVMSNFAITERLELLQTVFDGGLATSQQAFGELQAGVQAGKLPGLDWSWLPVWTLAEEELPITIAC